LKQRLEFPLQGQIDTKDRLPKIQGQKSVATTVRFCIRKTLKLWIDWPKCTAKKLLKQRLDFPFEKEIKNYG